GLRRLPRAGVARLGCRQADQRERDAALAADIRVRLQRVEEMLACERRLPVPEVRPRELVEDPRFLQPVAAGLERRKRLPVEVERTGKSPAAAASCASPPSDSPAPSASPSRFWIASASE